MFSESKHFDVPKNRRGRPRAPLFSFEQIKQMHLLREGGMKVKEIADRFGTSHPTITKYLAKPTSDPEIAAYQKRHEVSVRHRPFSDEVKLRTMLELYRLGTGALQISKLFGVDHTSVLYQLRKHLSPEEYEACRENARRMRGSLPPLPLPNNQKVPAPPPPSAKYAHLVEEPVNSGANYATLLARDRQKTTAERQERMRKLKAEKARRRSKWEGVKPDNFIY